MLLGVPVRLGAGVGVAVRVAVGVGIAVAVGVAVALGLVFVALFCLFGARAFWARNSFQTLSHHRYKA